MCQTRRPKRHDFSRSRWQASALSFLLLLGLGACGGAGPQEQNTRVSSEEHVCSSCHGIDGKSLSSNFPRLAGQRREYLVTQLKAFRDRSRADPHAHTYMWGMAARLTDADIDALADYYSKQSPAPGSPGNPQQIAAGQKIFMEGASAQNVPACVQCHGEKAEGNDQIPRLAGQHQSYLERQLDAFAENTRANEIMHENTVNMTPQQIDEVAAYLASQ
jgi:cytochrome c553